LESFFKRMPRRPFLPAFGRALAFGAADSTVLPGAAFVSAASDVDVLAWVGADLFLAGAFFLT
jgi:hypothetical protein